MSNGSEKRDQIPRSIQDNVGAVEARAARGTTIADQLSSIEAQVQLGRTTATPQRSLLQALQHMAAEDADDYAQLIKAIRAFMERKRADLDRRERLMGTK